MYLYHYATILSEAWNGCWLLITIICGTISPPTIVAYCDKPCHRSTIFYTRRQYKHYQKGAMYSFGGRHCNQKRNIILFYCVYICRTLLRSCLQTVLWEPQTALKWLFIQLWKDTSKYIQIHISYTIPLVIWLILLIWVLISSWKLHQSVCIKSEHSILAALILLLSFALV